MNNRTDVDYKDLPKNLVDASVASRDVPLLMSLRY